jgi:hypothetical protein
MLTTFLLMVGGATVIVFVVLGVVVIGIRHEPTAEGLTSQPPNAMSAWVRHLLGVYVRKPGQPPAHNEDHRELPGNRPVTQKKSAA